MAILKKINDLLGKFLNLTIVLALVGMVVFVFAQVIWRYVLRQPLSWSEELSRYLFSYVTLFGAAVLFRDSKHINMSLFVDLVKNPTGKRLVQLLANLFSLIFLVILIWYGFPMAKMILEFDVLSPSMEWMKMGWVFMMVPVASVLSAIMLIEVILSGLAALGKGGN